MLVFARARLSPRDPACKKKLAQKKKTQKYVGEPKQKERVILYRLLQAAIICVRSRYMKVKKKMSFLGC